ncbi:hypothetical protein TCAL_16847 [Tigriopus californicus]|uniref:Coiled-coil domain-containing protein 93 n=2 Tax=Tigriopus californicus TaxID=6832 RepID=A0A553PDY5_TIGCA|nr:hypothetical protein TCAL_16847 [Tigriopus californicus]
MAVLDREDSALATEGQDVDREIQVFLAMSDQERKLLKRLQKLVKLNEELKARESSFKASCKGALKDLQSQNEELRARLTQSLDQNHQDEGQLSQRIQELSALRSTVAEKVRMISILERQVDDVPSAYELAQYQKRFLELDNQMADEYSQTQQFYTLFNTLESQRSFMSKEVSMLTSIAEGLPKMGKNAVQRDHFLRQLEALLREVEQSKRGVEDFGREEELAKMKAQTEVHSLLEIQRQYAILVRDFRDAMKRNASLKHRVVATNES